MSTLVFILLVLLGLSLLCALLIISAAVVSSRSSKCLSYKGLIDLTEETSISTKSDSTVTPKHKEHTTTRMAV